MFWVQYDIRLPEEPVNWFELFKFIQSGIIFRSTVPKIAVWAFQWPLPAVLLPEMMRLPNLTSHPKQVFVVPNANQRATPILGYSLTYSAGRHPPHQKWLCYKNGFAESTENSLHELSPIPSFTKSVEQHCWQRNTDGYELWCMRDFPFTEWIVDKCDSNYTVAEFWCN